MNAQYLKERQLPILHLFKAVHDDSMSKSHTYRLTVQQELTKANGNLEKPVSTIKDKIAEQVKLIGNYTITYSSDDLSQVTSKIVRDKSYIVNLRAAPAVAGCGRRMDTLAAMPVCIFCAIPVEHASPRIMLKVFFSWGGSFVVIRASWFHLQFAQT